jgi:uncharacterized membrane protein
MSQNPYEASFSNATDRADVGPGGEVAETLLSMARWQTFFAVLGLILCGFMFIVVMLQVIGMSFGGARASVAGGVVVFFLGTLVYLLPTIRLFQATAAIRKFSRNQASLSDVMLTQRSFWRTIGIIASVVLSIYVLILFVALFGLGMGMARF